MFNTYFEDESVVDYKVQALDNIRAELEAEYVGSIYDLHDIVFNSGYYVIGRYRAKQELYDELDVFEVIGAIAEYEKTNFGEIVTDLSEPEKVLNVFYYLVGELCIQELDNRTNLEWEEVDGKEDREKLINEIDKMTKELEDSQ